MNRSELRDDYCPVCETRLSEAEHVTRHPVVYSTDEFYGEPGFVIVAECSCGHTAVIPLSVDLRRVA